MSVHSPPSKPDQVENEKSMNGLPSKTATDNKSPGAKLSGTKWFKKLGLSREAESKTTEESPKNQNGKWRIFIFLI